MSAAAEGAYVPGEQGYDLAPPQAASLVESLRAFGYELPTALADLVDNSITAGARNIWIDFHWDGKDSVIAVTDDGKGMSAEALVAAMRPGSQNPLQQREPHDLGRFGLGLKTASFSQCRRVTVRSRTKEGEAATRCWDLDHIANVNEWQLLRAADAAAEPRFHRFDGLHQGTTVLWQKLDRLVANEDTNNHRHQDRFLKRAEEVREHLGVVFHELMAGREAMVLYLNEHPIRPWDPFLAGEAATQTLPSTTLGYCDAQIMVKPYILPHHSKVAKTTHAAAAGPRGWNAHQGFYIYRNRRLLVPGDWLGFGWSKEEHYKLARIRVDIPNSLDHDWGIDVTKSRALPPPLLCDELRRIGERAREDAKRVYSFRGAKLVPQADTERVFLWEPTTRHGLTFCRLNHKHPLLKHALDCTADKPALNALLRLIEETVPYPRITIASSESPGSLPGPFDQAAEGQVREVMEQAFRSLVLSGYGSQQAADRLRTIWPFELFPALLESLTERPPHA